MWILIASHNVTMHQKKQVKIWFSHGTLMEKAMAPHSSTLAWQIPWMEEPGRLQSMGSHRVRHDWSDLAATEPGRLQSMGSLRVRHNWATSLSLLTFMPWKRKWQPTPVFLPGESQGRGSLVGCRLWVTQSRTWLMWLSSNSSSSFFLRKKKGNVRAPLKEVPPVPSLKPSTRHWRKSWNFTLLKSKL